MTTQLIKIKPAKPDVKVRKQDGAFLSEAGEIVKRSPYWIRRMKDGDVELVTDASTKATKGDK